MDRIQRGAALRDLEAFYKSHEQGGGKIWDAVKIMRVDGTVYARLDIVDRTYPGAATFHPYTLRPPLRARRERVLDDRGKLRGEEGGQGRGGEGGAGGADGGDGRGGRGRAAAAVG